MIQLSSSLILVIILSFHQPLTINIVIASSSSSPSLCTPTPTPNPFRFFIYSARHLPILPTFLHWFRVFCREFLTRMVSERSEMEIETMYSSPFYTLLSKWLLSWMCWFLYALLSPLRCLPWPGLFTYPYLTSTHVHTSHHLIIITSSFHLHMKTEDANY